MQFKTIITIPDDATYGGVTDLREYLVGYGSVSEVKQGDERFIEFTWQVEVDEPAVMDWAVHATRSSMPLDDRKDIIGQYVSLVNFHDEVYGEIGRRGFSARGPQRVLTAGAST